MRAGLCVFLLCSFALKFATEFEITKLDLIIRFKYSFPRNFPWNFPCVDFFVEISASFPRFAYLLDTDLLELTTFKCKWFPYWAISQLGKIFCE